MKVLIFGHTGMLGSMVTEVFSRANFPIKTIGREELNAENATISVIQEAVAGFDYVINCIGLIKSHIHDDNSEEVQRAILVNAIFPHRLAAAAANAGAKVIQIATDCVFDGARGLYTEKDPHNPLDVYGKTKSLGEVVGDNFFNLRCSIIGPEKKGRLSLMEWFLNQPSGARVNGFTNHLWNGVSTLAFAKICVGIIANNYGINHIQHIMAADIVSKARMLRDFAEVFGRSDIEISDTKTSSSIDRSLSTLDPEINKTLWEMAGYGKIPTVGELIYEMRDYDGRQF